MDTNTRQAIHQIERPHSKLLTYYILSCLATGPLFIFLILPACFKYRTLRYRFDDEGISMRWGILFRREIILNYARIQDIHLSANFIERWLGLARIQIQTASGSAAAEMTIEGVLEYEALRDFLYSQMRGQKEPGRPAQATPIGGSVAVRSEDLVALTAELRRATEELRAIRAHLVGGSNDTRPLPEDDRA